MDGTSTIQNGRSLVGLFSDLWRDTTTLVREEAELARVEISQKVGRMESAAASIAIGGAVLFAGLIVLLLAAVAGLEQLLPPPQSAWLAPLIVGGIVAIIGFALVSRARKNLSAASLTPTRTMRSLQRDRELAREHLA
jgi:xanthine/uracil permease